jgi:hypothetical protein
MSNAARKQISRITFVLATAAAAAGIAGAVNTTTVAAPQSDMHWTVAADGTCPADMHWSVQLNACVANTDDMHW